MFVINEPVGVCSFTCDDILCLSSFSGHIPLTVCLDVLNFGNQIHPHQLNHSNLENTKKLNMKCKNMTRQKLWIALLFQIRFFSRQILDNNRYGPGAICTDHVRQPEL